MLIWQIYFYCATVFLHKSVKWSKKFFVHLLEHGYTQCTYSPQEIFRQQKMHWQFRIELVKHILHNAWQQPWEIIPVPDPDDCPLHLVDKHFIEPYQAKKGVGRKHPCHACFICNVSKEALLDAGFEDSYKPKKYTSCWCPICKCALCIDPCFKLYHTEKDYTSEIIKIARMSVKCI